jgi:hypothetical protein
VPLGGTAPEYGEDMTLSIHIEPDSGVAIATCSGVLRVTDAMEGAAALWETEGWSGRAAVWDFRGARFDLASSDVREIAQFILSRQRATPPSKIAFVTDVDADFGMARVFEAYREDARTAFQVFRDYTEAVCWARSHDPAVGR